MISKIFPSYSSRFAKDPKPKFPILALRLRGASQASGLGDAEARQTSYTAPTPNNLHPEPKRQTQIPNIP